MAASSSRGYLVRSHPRPSLSVFSEHPGIPSSSVPAALWFCTFLRRSLPLLWSTLGPNISLTVARDTGLNVTGAEAESLGGMGTFLGASGTLAAHFEAVVNVASCGLDLMPQLNG